MDFIKRESFQLMHGYLEGGFSDMLPPTNIISCRNLVVQHILVFPPSISTAIAITHWRRGYTSAAGLKNLSTKALQAKRSILHSNCNVGFNIRVFPHMFILSLILAIYAKNTTST